MGSLGHCAGEEYGRDVLGQVVFAPFVNIYDLFMSFLICKIIGLKYGIIEIFAVGRESDTVSIPGFLRIAMR